MTMAATATTEILAPQPQPVEYPSTTGSLQLAVQYHRIEADEHETTTNDCSDDDDAMRTPLPKRRRLTENPFQERPPVFPRTVSLLVGDRDNGATCTSTRGSKEYTEAIKCHPHPHEANNNDDKQQRTVHFTETVRVREIASHRECCPTVREQLWNSLREIQANAARNELEFAADNNDWRRATEEDEFCLWREESSQTSELVHPATFEKRQRERQLAILLQEEAEEKDTSPCSQDNESFTTNNHRGLKRTNEGPPLRRIAKVASFQDLSIHR